MATAIFSAERVKTFAVLRKVELEEEMASAKEEFISKPRTRTIGFWWWKATVERSRKECEFLYEKGHFPEVAPFMDWPYRLTLEDTYSTSIRRCDRIIRLCEAAEGTVVTLDDSEASFLKLPKG